MWHGFAGVLYDPRIVDDDHNTAPAPPLALRPVRADDIPALHRNETDPVSSRMAGVKPRDRASFQEYWEKIIHDPGVLVRTITLGDEFTGYVTCFEQEGRRWIGYWIGRPWWGRGIATWALGELLELVEPRPLHAQVARWNNASIRVLERHGFVDIGRRVEPETGRYVSGEVITFRLD